MSDVSSDQIREQLRDCSAAEPTALDARGIARLQQTLREFAPKLLRYIDQKLPTALRRLVDPKDILQDTFVEAFRRAHEFQPVGEDATARWLFTIARNRLNALTRAQRVQQRSERFSQLISFLQQLAVYTRTPSRSAMRHELASAVQQSVQSLEPNYQEAIRYRYMEGLSVEETASRMGRSQGSVMMLCMRGLKAIKLQLDLRSLDSRTEYLNSAQLEEKQAAQDRNAIDG
jgi:RNA polymerase sigma-70 factor, ECF subfamily